MAMIDAVLGEFDQESKATRRLLERVPDDKLAWRPHPKSSSLGQMALHVATIPAALSHLASQDVFELPEFIQPQPASRSEILSAFDESQKTAHDLLGGMDDPRLAATWTLVHSGATLMQMPRAALLRTLLLNHYYHHRGQLMVYLRLLDVPLPSVYGPTADENPFAQPAATAI